jgi:hypothetical protein
MDEADRAQEHYEPFLAARIAQAGRAAEKARLSPVGRCYNCDTALRGALLFCDADCTEDFEAERRARARSGL